mgnify:CR=1 FL=1
MTEFGTGTTVFDLVFPDLVMGENTVLCPFHSEKTPSMQINTMQKIYHCFGCGAGGNVIHFTSKIEKIFENLGFADDEESDSIEDTGDWEEKDGIVETVVGFFNWVAYIFKSLGSLIIFVAAIGVNTFPIINAFVSDLLIFVKIVFYLLYAVPM